MWLGRAVSRGAPWPALLLLLAGWLVAGTPRPAEAHGGQGHYISTVTVIEPPLAGLSVWIEGEDTWVVLTNRSGREVTVLGYEGEPYLLFREDGVFANRRSPAFYINDDRYGATRIPEDAHPGAEPEWERVAAGSTYAWHDHRIHWMSTTPPESVRQDSSKRQVIFEWKIPLLADGPILVHGRLEWVPVIDLTPWLGIGAVMLALLAFVSARRSGALQRVHRPAAAAAVALALAGLTAVALSAAGQVSAGSALVDAATVLVCLAVVALAARFATDPSRPGALALAGALAGLVLLGGVLRADALGDFSSGSVPRAIMAVIVTAELVLGAAAVVFLAVAAAYRAAGAPRLAERHRLPP